MQSMVLEPRKVSLALELDNNYWMHKNDSY